MFYAFYQIAPITSNTYCHWMNGRAFRLVHWQAYVGQFLETFKEYPPRQKQRDLALFKLWKS
ncbi:hypothetical protein [Pseudoalteromonas sp. G4]|uniref:hypothetical protein n=1 Tax=Pseudoalteromonas sp. G4 TaxID=2992761 RepID=UPI00237E4BAA|nr:hypothetical protein [Pseudoalteromonas sp. G4]MDE3270497.1 hypothetical protein [Pseudoalteromonas sp. G4]